MLPHWPLRLYYDGDCPLCAREVALLRHRNSAERLVLIDSVEKVLMRFLPENVGR